MFIEESELKQVLSKAISQGMYVGFGFGVIMTVIAYFMFIGMFK